MLAPLPLAAQVVLSGISYNENFNNLGSGLPTGWSVYSSATSSSLGTSATFTTSKTDWNAATAGTELRNISSNSGAVWNDSSANQTGNGNRALGWRPLSAASRQGAITLTLANTEGFTDFNLSFTLFVANDVSGSQSYDVEYRVGDSGSFGKLGSTFTTPASGSTSFTVASYSLDPTALAPIANQSAVVYLRVRGTSASGSGNLDTIGIDNFTLTYAAVPEAEEYGMLAGLGALTWVTWRRGRRREPTLR